MEDDLESKMDSNEQDNISMSNESGTSNSRKRKRMKLRNIISEHFINIIDEAGKQKGIMREVFLKISDGASDFLWRDRTEKLMLGTSDWRSVYVSRIDSFLDFNVARKIPMRDKYMGYTRSSKYNWQLNGIRRLGRLFAADPRLALSTDDVRHLVGFLRLRDKPQLQGNVACTLSNVVVALSNVAPNGDGVEVIINEAIPLLVPRIKSKCGNGWLQVEALKALARIAYAAPRSCEVILQNGALELLEVVVLSRLKRIDVVSDSATLLAAVCCGEPHLPYEKTTLVLRIVETLLLLGIDFEDAMPQICSTLSYISDKRFVPMDKKAFGHLLQLISHDFPSVAVSSLEAVGNIVRGGDDEQVQFMIDAGVLQRLWNLLRHKYMILRKEACMIIANIIARKPSWIKDITLANLILPLVILSQKDEVDVKVEAIAALANAYRASEWSDSSIEECVTRDLIMPLTREKIDEFLNAEVIFPEYYVQAETYHPKHW